MNNKIKTGSKVKVGIGDRTLEIICYVIFIIAAFLLSFAAEALHHTHAPVQRFLVRTHRTSRVFVSHQSGRAQACARG